MERKPTPLAAIAARVLRRSRQAVEAHHHEHVAGDLELTHLSSNPLAVRRDLCIALNHRLICYYTQRLKSPFRKTHLLIPQIEVAMRSIADQAGLAVTKAHPKVTGTSVAIGIGDILYASAVTDVLGPDITLHLQALFADPRGLDLRNEMAHGLLGASAFDGHVARLLIHCLLMLGIWKELARKSFAAN